jgi:hypothetical protein
VAIGGERVPDVSVRKKGFLGSLSTVRPSLKLDFGRGDHDGRTFHGTRDLTLNNNHQDRTNAKQCVAYDKDWNVVFNPGSITIAPSLVGSSCEGCSLSTPPEAVTGYEWRRAELLKDVQASDYTLTKLIGSTGYRYTASITTAATNWDTQIKAVKPALAPGESIKGFTAMVIESETSAGINDPGNGHVRLTGLHTAYDLAAPHRVLIVNNGDGGVHIAALSPAAAFDEINEVSSANAALERTFIHYARIGVGGTPPGDISFAAAEIYYAVKLA